MEKTYSNRSNCIRAAKKSGLAKFTIVEIDGKFGFEDAAPVAVMAPKAPKVASKAKPAKVSIAKKAPKKVAARTLAPSEKPGTKGAQLIELVSQGATITELMETLGWLPHTVRAALSRLGKAGYAVTRTKVGSADDGFESHYKIAS